jgi:hypothetical protein
VGIIKKIINFFNHIPSHEEMDKDPVFRAFFFRYPLKTPKKTKSFFWICYLSMRATILSSLFFAIIAIYKLIQLEDLNANAVLSILKLYCFSNSIPLLIIIMPYYYFKSKKEIGFEGIKYRDTIDRGRPPIFEHEPKKFLNRYRWILLVLTGSFPFSYLVIFYILSHYGLLNNINWLIASLTFYSIVGFPAIMSETILLILSLSQCKLETSQKSSSKTISKD